MQGINEAKGEVLWLCSSESQNLQVVILDPQGSFQPHGKKTKVPLCTELGCRAMRGAQSWAAAQRGQHSGVCARALQCRSAALRWGLTAGQPCQTLAETAVNLFVMLIVQDPHLFSTPASLLRS